MDRIRSTLTRRWFLDLPGWVFAVGAAGALLLFVVVLTAGPGGGPGGPDRGDTRVERMVWDTGYSAGYTGHGWFEVPGKQACYDDAFLQVHAWAREFAPDISQQRMEALLDYYVRGCHLGVEDRNAGRPRRE